MAYKVHPWCGQRKGSASLSTSRLRVPGLTPTGVVSKYLEDVAHHPPNTWARLPSHTTTACVWLVAEMTAAAAVTAAEYIAHVQNGRVDTDHHANRLVLSLAWSVVTVAAIRTVLLDMSTCATTTQTLVKLLLFLQLALGPLRSAVLGVYPNPEAAVMPVSYIVLAAIYSVLVVLIYRYHVSVGDSLVQRFATSGRRAAIMALGSIYVFLACSEV